MDFADRPLRIIHSEAAGTFGGQEHRVFKEMMAMRERGHFLEAICQPGSMLGERLMREGFRAHLLKMDGIANYLKGIYKVACILRAGRFDVLNTHSRRDTVIAAAAGRLAGTPLIVRTRHLAKPPGSLWTYTGLPHKVVAVSDCVREQLIKRQVEPADVATVHTAIAAMHRLEHSSLRSELSIPESDIVVCCVGHLRVQKGQRQLMDAMAQIMQVRNNVRLVFVGSGSQWEPLQQHALELGHAARVHFLGRRDDIANILSGSNIFALATQFEALGTAFLEAEFCGLPVVGTRVGGVPEAVVDGITGFLVPCGDEPALIHALTRLVDDPDLRKSMGQAGASILGHSARFTVQRMAQHMERSYLKWLAGVPAAQKEPAF